MTKPVFGWVGGKQRLVSRYIPVLGLVPCRRYIEPFCGSAGVYIRLMETRTILPTEGVLLADTDTELCNVHAAVRDYPEEVIRVVEYHRERHCRDHFLSVRDAYVCREVWTEADTDPERAGDFIYIVHCSYGKNPHRRENGTLRGGYGGDIMKRGMVPPDRIRRISEIMKPATIMCASFEETMQVAGDGDFVYADPPYLFPWKQRFSDGYRIKATRFQSLTWRLLSELDALVERGGRFAMSNMEDPRLIRWALLRGYDIHSFRITRTIRRGSHGDKEAKEILVCQLR